MIFFYNRENIFIQKHRSISHTVVSIFLNYIYVFVIFFLNFASPSRTWKTDIVDGECDCKVVFFKLKKKTGQSCHKKQPLFQVRNVLQIWISLPCHEYIFGNPLGVSCLKLPSDDSHSAQKKKGEKTEWGTGIKPQREHYCKAVLALSVHLRGSGKEKTGGCEWLTDDSNKSKNKLAI